MPTKENDSFYIKSTYGANEGKVLYSKDGGVGLYTQSDYHDQWFYFEPGQDYLEGNYRLVTRYTNKVIVSKPGISNYHADGAKYDDQYWSFVE